MAQSSSESSPRTTTAPSASLDSLPSSQPSLAEQQANTTVTVLQPDYRVALGVIALAAPLVWLQWIAGSVVALFGVFLAVQTATLRLAFTDSALAVYRGETCIRYFPYADWENWRIFWSPVPILFYFKEVNSIHFLPMLFSAEMLRTALDHHDLPQKI